jgi:quinol monooxygenase YgiN
MPAQQLTIIANIHAKAGQTDLVKTELLKLIEPTRAEEGCLQYNLHQDPANPTHFVFFENWASRELWQAHMSKQHLVDYIAATEGAVDAFIVHEMTQIA